MEAKTLACVKPEKKLKYDLEVSDELLNSEISDSQMQAVIEACCAHQSFLPSGERQAFLLGKVSAYRFLNVKVY